ncbi:MAG: hypothetical protein WCL21_04785 [Mariniphaga sp.]
MLSAAIILPDEAEMPSANSLLSIKGIEWSGIFHSGKNKKNHSLNHSFIFSTIEIIPLINDLLIIADPNLCTFEYLSFAIRNGCHLSLPDKLQLTTHERRQLVHLADEGGTFIQIQNDFLFHPFQEKIRSQSNRIRFIEASQSAPGKHDQLNEMLLNNLLMILRAAGSPVRKLNVFTGTMPSSEPDVLNIHINFKNGSVAALTLKFIGVQKAHILSLHSGGEVTNFDFIQNKISYFPDKKTNGNAPNAGHEPFKEQINDFIKNISEKNSPGFSLDDENQVFLLMEKIREKIGMNSYSMQ